MPFKKKIKSSKRIHLDYAATTPVHPDVVNAMEPFWNQVWANPSAIYKEGVASRNSVEISRERLARTLRVRPTDITFTSGGTESNNLAIYGSIRALVEKGSKFEDLEIITTRVEHPSIIATVKHLAECGVKITYASVDEEGLVDTKSFEKLLSPETSLVTFAYVNSETGVIQDVKKITRIIRKWNEARNSSVLVHVDACQAPLWLSCALDALGVDMMSLDAGKCYGPKSSGILVHRHGTDLLPIILGGDQESGLRAGTENPALIIGCVESLVRAQDFYEERSNRIIKVRDYGFDLIKKEIPNVFINGTHEARVANNINVSIPGFDTEFTVIVLDKEGVAASTRSACGSEKSEGSSVVREMTKDDARANSTLRFTLGEDSKKEDIEQAVLILKNHIEHMKNSL